MLEKVPFIFYKKITGVQKDKILAIGCDQTLTNTGCWAGATRLMEEVSLIISQRSSTPQFNTVISNRVSQKNVRIVKVIGQD